MSAFQQRENSGILFKNDKGDNTSRPDYRGDLNVGGSIYEISAWVKQGQKGKFMSLSVKPKSDHPQKPAAKKPAPEPEFVDNDLDSLPF